MSIIMRFLFKSCVVSVLFLLITNLNSYAQNTLYDPIPVDIIKKWKVDQFYLDSVLVEDVFMDSIRYEFYQDGNVNLALLGENEFLTPYYLYTDPNKVGRITILYNPETNESITYDVWYLSPYSLIF